LPVYQQQSASEWVLYLYHIAHRHIFALAICLLLYLSLFPQGLGRFIDRFFAAKIWYPISQLSYSIYLFHLAVLVLLGALLSGTGILTIFSYNNVFLLALLSFPFRFIICCLLFVFVERPFMKLR
jgi:peptidoglycan/LPS O-acetylase OafA/YrhL